MLTVRQSTLPSLWWEKPETSEVPISEKWTAAEAAAGATPAASSRVDDVTPYAMPSEPSMSWASRPTKPRTMSLRIADVPLRSLGDRTITERSEDKSCQNWYLRCFR